MPDYLDLDLNLDASTLYQDSVDAIATLAPDDWEPSPLEQWILEAISRIAVELAVLAGTVPLTIFQYFGQSVLDVPADTAVAATSTVTFTALDDAGHVIDAGTQLTVDGVAFTTDSALSIPTGSTTGTIGITAVDDGTAGNGLIGDTIDIVSPSYLFIDDVVLDADTDGGQDAETGQEYADRLADELPTLSPKAIYIDDFEAIARRNPAVGRALAIDNYNPIGPDPAAEGHVSVVVHDADGANVSSPVKTAIAADLEGNRVLNLTVHVLDPDHHTIDVAYTATVYADYDPASVQADADAALAAYLAPTAWGRPSFDNTSSWINETTIYRNDLIGVVRNVQGIRHVSALTLGPGGGSLSTSDIVMTGPAPLPTSGTITGTVT